jgi:hypothetical protein
LVFIQENCMNVHLISSLQTQVCAGSAINIS